ncbi:hypothetical protein DW083_17485, partial [Parabacteroides sp. AF48-14]|uniref:hypothetical protein n=1 Tax=Parabacteroides sp. AF48-14 TaxID=2292052 RepID=UPI000FF3A0C6
MPGYAGLLCGFQPLSIIYRELFIKGAKAHRGRGFASNLQNRSLKRLCEKDLFSNQINTQPRCFLKSEIAPKRLFRTIKV